MGRYPGGGWGGLAVIDDTVMKGKWTIKNGSRPSAVALLAHEDRREETEARP